MKRVLDTNILIAHFLALRPLAGKGASDAVSSARRLIEDRGTDEIVSPVEVEFLCGVLERHEMRLREAFLSVFKVIDEHSTIPKDWSEAARYAKHPGFHASPRDLGDCLVSAIADRLGREVISDDKGLHRQRGRTRQKRP